MPFAHFSFGNMVLFVSSFKWSYFLQTPQVSFEEKNVLFFKSFFWRKKCYTYMKPFLHKL